MWFDKDANI
jgi:hypothetical protein